VLVPIHIVSGVAAVVPNVGNAFVVNTIVSLTGFIHPNPNEEYST